MISINRNCNFHVTFKNGVTVSIFIGGGSHSDNRDAEIGREAEQEQVSSNAEIAAWANTPQLDGSTWVTRALRPDTEDDVIGYQSPEQILDFLNKAAAYVPAPLPKEVSK